MGKECRIGLGMFTVHRAVEENMTAAFQKLSNMGYKGIEFYGEPSDFAVGDVKDALKESGLQLTGWHIEWKNLQEDTIDGTVRYLHEVGCQTAIVPCLGGRWNVGHDSRYESKDRWLFYIQWLNETNRRLAAEGLRLGYHNHEHEFVLNYDGKTVFDLLFENLAPEIIMEFDSGNCIEAGKDPMEVLRTYRERPLLLHLKPYSRERGFDVVLGEDDDANDWQAILHRQENMPEWLLVESENKSLAEMENAEKCFCNLKKYL